MEGIWNKILNSEYWNGGMGIPVVEAVQQVCQIHATAMRI
jgi:hypothetical protein